MATTMAGGRGHTVRAGYLLLGLGLTVGAIAGAAAWSTGVWSVLAFAVLPDVSFLAAIGQPAERGQLPRRAVPLYNLLHRPILPLLLVAGAVADVLGAYWLVAGLSWIAHIAFDRASGYGLRTSEGWQRA